MSQKTPIFFTGATGYIGGAVLARLLNHPNRDTFQITTLVRNPEKAKILTTKFGVNAVIGSHQEYDKIEKLVEDNHVIFHTADADDEPLIMAILKGLRNRHRNLGDMPVIIHTSGTGVLADDARGEYQSQTTYSDLNVKELRAIPPTAYHRTVDLRVVDIDEKGHARSHIILPSTVYGVAKHPLVEAGVANPYSIQIPTLIRASLRRGRAGVVGKGLAMWPSVHTTDLSDLYMVLFDNIVKNPDKTGHGWQGFYYAENGEHEWLDISKAIGQAMHELGLTDNPEPTEFTVDELKKYFGYEELGWYFGSNVRVTADRGRALGWQPKYTKQDMLASIKPEVELYAKKP
ncbi:NAD(P)-binding protein [Ganoderma leucocontextum]|nr:NAD(P)-binding protein [Ganoderma leucocontextum]